MELSRADRAVVLSARLRAQAISEPLGSIGAAIDRMLAVQAQDAAAAGWALGLRAGSARVSASAAQIEDALARGELVRSWPMRGTLHLIRPEELAWLLPLTRDRAVAAAAGRHRQLGLDDAQFARASAAARHALADGSLRRAELLAAMEADGVSTDGQRGAHLLVRLAQDGVVALVDRKRFALLDRIGPTAREIDPDAALGELALRYFTGHGPATVRDLAWWAGLTLATARDGLNSARDRLSEMSIDGVQHYGVGELTPVGPRVDVLAGFDEFVLGYADRGAALGEHALERVVPGANGMFLSTVHDSGRVVGTWRRTPAAGGIRIELHWLGAPLASSRRSMLNAALSRWARHAGTTIADVIG